MRFHWLRDQECQQQFRVYWRPGKVNYADYWMKHHPAPHHQNMHKEFLTLHIILEMLRIEQQTHAARAAWRTQETPQNQRAQVIMHETKTFANRQNCWNKGHKKIPAKQNFQKSLKIAELEGTINTPSEGTNNYAQTKTSEKRQYYAQNKISENLQKITKLEGTINTPPFAPFFNFVIYTTMDTWQGCDDLSLLRPDPWVT